MHKDKITPHKNASTPHKGKSTPDNGRATPHKGKITPDKGRATPYKCKGTPDKGRATPYEDRSTLLQSRFTPAAQVPPDAQRLPRSAPPRARARPEIHPEARTLHIGRRGKRARHLLLVRVGEDGVAEVARVLYDGVDLAGWWEDAGE